MFGQTWCWWRRPVSAHPGGEQIHDLIKGEIADAGEDTEDHRGDNDHNRGVTQLGLGGPGALLKFTHHFTEEDAGAAERVFHSGNRWQARRESNPQPTVLETATLPIELRACFLVLLDDTAEAPLEGLGESPLKIQGEAYSMISVIRPAPIVRPPSRMANFCVFSIAMGEIKSISTAMLSPGMIISTPFGRLTTPVTSVVRK
jgi:hypothetical protein